MPSANKSYSQEEMLLFILKKDKAAFGIFYNTYLPVICSVISKLTHDQRLSEEIIEKVFVKIWQNISVFDPSKQRLVAWILAIARNTANDVIKNSSINDSLQIQQLNNNVNLYNKDILSLVYFKGYSLKMAAEALNITMEEARAELKKTLDQFRTVTVK